MTERELQTAVLDLAGLLGWLAYHTFDSRRSQAGFPDLVLVRERIIFVELKTEKGQLTEAQKHWRELIEGAEGEYHLWRPADLQNFATQTLKRRGPWAPMPY